VRARAQDFSDNIVQMAFARATDPDDIGFGARATMHADELGYDPYGRTDPLWSQFGTVDIAGTVDDPDGDTLYSHNPDSNEPGYYDQFGDPDAAKTLLLLGDSTAMQWYGAIDIAARQLGYKVIAAPTVNAGGGMFTLANAGDGLWTSADGSEAKSVAKTDTRFNWIKDNLWEQADAVVVAVNPDYFTLTGADPERSPQAAEKLAATLRGLREATGARPVLVQAIPPILDFNNQSGMGTEVVYNYINGNDKASLGVRPRMDMVYDLLLEAGAAEDFAYLRIESLFCDADGASHTQIGGAAVYNDTIHINAIYSASAGEYFTAHLRELL